MFWSSSILEAWIFPIWRFTAAFPAEQAWHFWVHHRFWQTLGESSLPLALCRALEGCGMAPGLPTTSCCFSCLQQPAAKKSAVLLPTFATGNWGGLATGVCCSAQNLQVTRLFNCHFWASQWRRGSWMSLLLLPGLCDSPLYPSGNL